MREILKSAFVVAFRLLLHGFFVFPIRNNRVFFSAYAGKRVTCNPLAVFEALRVRHGDALEYVWCVRDASAREALQKSGVRAISYGTPAYFYYLLTARTVLMNDLTGCSYLPFRRGQAVIQTWHGCGLYKKVGHDVPTQPRGYHARLRYIARHITLFTSGAAAFSKTVIRGAFGYEGEILECGLPRNDLLLDEDARARAAQKVREALHILPDRTLVLYAPTFRDSGEHAAHFFEDPAVRAALRDRFGDYTLLLRTHYMAPAEQADARFADVTAYPEMQELLCAADVLISDYSSCIWDFSLMQKPCFLYAPDLANYRTERDFYLDIRAWPFPLATTNAELIDNLRGLDIPLYRHRVAEHLQDLGSCESGTAAAQIAAVIAEYAGISS